MSVFADLNEIRHLGAPIVGLFHTALGRDPDPLEIQRFARMLRDRSSLTTIVSSIVATPEYLHRYADLASTDRTKIFLSNALGPKSADFDARGITEWAGSDAELIALISNLALTRGDIPLLPGLVPGATPDDPTAYRLWVSEYDPTSVAPQEAPDGQLVSLLMKAGDTEAEAAERSVATLTRQAHRQWELCLVAHTVSPWCGQTIEALARDEPRVRLIEGQGLAAALTAATGPLVGVLAPGDTLAPDALARITAAWEPATELVFTDDDVEDASGRHSPRFMPGFSPDRPLPVGSLVIARRTLFDPATGQLTGQPDLTRVRHVPIVALHRAAAKASEPDTFADAAFAMPQPPPPVTVVVLTKDHPELLAACSKGLLEHTDYPALTLILVDNGTTDDAALALLTELERRSNVRVLRRPGPFNFAALNNDAVRTVDGGMLLLLNNDVEIPHSNWLSEMVAQLARPGVGIVGARLLYPDRTIQHAGILLGPGGRATHVGRGAAETDTGYLGQLTGVRDFSAVTGACLAITVETWNRVGGMDERFAVTWNDVDLCLRVRRAGLRVVWTPRATLIHRESTTRGLEAEDAAKLARFREEQALMLAEWGDAFDRDPFLNANLLALDSGQLVLTRPRQLASRA